MNKNIYAIQVDCNSNPDIDNTYYQKDLIEELKDLGLPTSDWLEYLLDHIFIEYSDWSEDLAAAFENEHVSKMNLNLNGDEITLKKIYS